MKTDILKQYASLSSRLHREKTELEARLQQINQVLGTNEKAASSQPSPAQKGFKTMSAAARRKISAALKSRWAEKRGSAQIPAASTATKPASKGKRKVSAEARAKMAAAQKARRAREIAGAKK